MLYKMKSHTISWILNKEPLWIRVVIHLVSSDCTLLGMLFITFLYTTEKMDKVTSFRFVSMVDFTRYLGKELLKQIQLELMCRITRLTTKKIFKQRQTLILIFGKIILMPTILFP